MELDLFFLIRHHDYHDLMICKSNHIIIMHCQNTKLNLHANWPVANHCIVRNFELENLEDK